MQVMNMNGEIGKLNGLELHPVHQPILQEAAGRAYLAKLAQQEQQLLLQLIKLVLVFYQELFHKLSHNQLVIVLWMYLLFLT